MKFKQLKSILDKMTPEQLKEDVLFNSQEFSISGVVSGVKKAKGNLYCTHEDDPSPLYTLSQLKDQGMDREEIEECDIEIPKGSFYINL